MCIKLLNILKAFRLDSCPQINYGLIYETRNMAYNECSYCFVTINMKVTDGTVVLHTPYNECSD